MNKIILGICVGSAVLLAACHDNTTTTADTASTASSASAPDMGSNTVVPNDAPGSSASAPIVASLPAGVTVNHEKGATVINTSDAAASNNTVSVDQHTDSSASGTSSTVMLNGVQIQTNGQVKSVDEENGKGKVVISGDTKPQVSSPASGTTN